MSYYGMGKASSGFIQSPTQGESSSTAIQTAPRSLASLCPAMPREAPASAEVSPATGLVRRTLCLQQAAPLQLSPAQLLREPDLQQPCEGACRSASTARWEGCRPFPPPAYAADPPANRWLCLASMPPQPLRQQAKDVPSSRGDSAAASWGFAPRSGVLLMSAKLRPEEGGQSALPALPPNICILTLAMMIAGIPTIPVPGACEEEMIQAAQCFMAEETLEGEVAGGRRRSSSSSWAALPHLGPPCKKDRPPRKRAAHRRLLPLFLAQLEK